MIRRLVVIAALLAAFMAPATAWAANWSWQGWITQSPSGNGACPWYNSQSACSGWANWATTVPWNQYGGGTILAGFENNSTIRGRYLSAGESLAIDPFSLGMSGSLKAHVTYSCCSGGGSHVTTSANT